MFNTWLNKFKLSTLSKTSVVIVCMYDSKPKIDKDSLEIFSLKAFLYKQISQKIDKDSSEILSTESPRIIVNPKPTPFGFRGFEIPREAFPDIRLDDPFVKDVDPQTWARRLAPKRAKNARQHQRRAEREWMMADTSAKAIALASKATKSRNTRNNIRTHNRLSTTDRRRRRTNRKLCIIRINRRTAEKIQRGEVEALGRVGSRDSRPSQSGESLAGHIRHDGGRHQSLR
ncbi:hypothetical protein EZV62_008871 [Acer yangbiense]|uniref:Uncharacterized protein n=1 Tax=Acer yangbiense TaxID=1000413 RepID=A0A5C7IGL9_9ROSI|nr:hypothetical protein EZV62_008871 [Acer yangbiense]